jgi:hypothetical protein
MKKDAKNNKEREKFVDEVNTLISFIDTLLHRLEIASISRVMFDISNKEVTQSSFKILEARMWLQEDLKNL